MHVAIMYMYLACACAFILSHLYLCAQASQALLSKCKDDIQQLKIYMQVQRQEKACMNLQWNPA